MLETFLIGLAVILVFGLIKSSIRSENIIENVVFSLIASPLIDTVWDRVHIYLEYHSVCPSSELGPLPSPLPSPEPKEEGDTIACGWVGGGIPIPTTGEKPSTLSTLSSDPYLETKCDTVYTMHTQFVNEDGQYFCRFTEIDRFC